jgi:hypothetical protein
MSSIHSMDPQGFAPVHQQAAHGRSDRGSLPGSGLTEETRPGSARVPVLRETHLRCGLPPSGVGEETGAAC